jgi:hypothetical protein
VPDPAPAAIDPWRNFALLQAGGRWLSCIVLLIVIPAKAGIQGSRMNRLPWTAAFAG